MAEFNVKPEAQPSPSYVGMSEGIRSSANTGLATLFEGIAGAVDSTVKLVDQDIKDRIEEDIFTEVDAVQAEFGIPEATDLESDAEEMSFRTSPAGVQRAGNQLKTLQTAYERGALKESNYWARMNNMVRQLRGKYPGYRAEIDQMVSSVTGARPANALRSALMSEWNSAQEGKSDYDKLVERAAFAGRLPPDFDQRAMSDNPYSQSEIISYVARKERVAADVGDRRATMAEHVDRQNLTKEEVVKNFRVEANSMVTNLLQDASSTVGSSYAQLQQRMNEARQQAGSGNPLSAEEIAGMRTQFNELRQMVQSELRRTYLTSWDGDPSHSYAAQLSSTDYEQIVSTAMVEINNLETALSSENPFGLLSANAAWLEALKDQNSAELLREFPFAQELSTLQATLGSEVVGQLLSLSPGLQRDIDKALISYRTLRLADAKQNGETITSVVDSDRSGEENATQINGMADTWTKIADQITKGDLPLSVVQNGAAYMFGRGSQEIFGMLDDQSKFDYFAKVASPAVSKQMMALRDNGDVESWQMYQRWVGNNFQVLFRDRVQSVQQMTMNPDNFTVTWDPRGNRFKAEMRVRGVPYSGNPIPIAFDNLNKALQVVAPIISDSDGDTGMEVMRILMEMGYNPDATPPENILSILGEAIANAMPSVSIGGESKRPPYRGSPNAPIQDINNMFGAGEGAE